MRNEEEERKKKKRKKREEREKVFFFFFKQKTAYEIYQCDWSSDVCSSDLALIDGTRYFYCGWHHRFCPLHKRHL